jgi:hypothetical protein
LDATACTPISPAFDPLTFIQTKLAEQRKQVLEVMLQNTSLMTVLSKSGGGGDGAAAVAAEAKAAAATAAVGTKPHGKRKNSAPNATKWLSTILRSFSPSRGTRTNAPRDGAPNAGNDRDRGPRIMTQNQNGFVKINLNVS